MLSELGSANDQDLASKEADMYIWCNFAWNGPFHSGGLPGRSDRFCLTDLPCKYGENRPLRVSLQSPNLMASGIEHDGYIDG
jgi:hypothetical protein